MVDCLISLKPNYCLPYYLAAVVDVLAAHHLVLPLCLQQLFEAHPQVLGEVPLGDAFDDATAVGVSGGGLVALL